MVRSIIVLVGLAVALNDEDSMLQSHGQRDRAQKHGRRSDKLPCDEDQQGSKYCDQRLRAGDCSHTFTRENSCRKTCGACDVDGRRNGEKEKKNGEKKKKNGEEKKKKKEDEQVPDERLPDEVIPDSLNFPADADQHCTQDEIKLATAWHKECAVQATTLGCKIMDFTKEHCCPQCINPAADTPVEDVEHRRRTKAHDWTQFNKNMAEATASQVRRRRSDKLPCGEDKEGSVYCSEMLRFDGCSHPFTREDSCKKTCGACDVDGRRNGEEATPIPSPAGPCVVVGTVDLCDPCKSEIQCQSGLCCPDTYRCISAAVRKCPGSHGQAQAKSTCGKSDCEDWPQCADQNAVQNDFCENGIVNNMTGEKVIDPQKRCCDTCA